MKRARRGPVELVEDLDGGEYVRVDAGLVRVTSREIGDERWAILLKPDLTETKDRIWLQPRTRVLEVLPSPSQSAPTKGFEADPLKGTP